MNRIFVRATTALAFVLVAGCSDDPTGPGAELLTSPATVIQLVGGEDSQRFYRINVPSGAARLTVTTTGIGNVDLYVQKDQRPMVTSPADCVSANIQASESCIIENPTAGTWFMLLYGGDAYNNVTLRVTVTMPAT